MATYGEGTGSIAFGDVDCEGSEDSLFDCPNMPPINNSNCSTHSSDASVVCAGNSLLNFVSAYDVCIHVYIILHAQKSRLATIEAG